MTVQYNPESVIRRDSKHVLIDADCVAYWGAATCDTQGEGVALHRTNLRMNQILDECRAQHYTAYLTGKDNFRDNVATLQRYKGNRYRPDGSRITPQPVYLSECREYLIEEWGAILRDGEEADDALSIHRARFPDNDRDYIISSIDKDLRINTGYHHNQNTGDIIHVLPDLIPLTIIEKISKTTGKTNKKIDGVGRMFFWAQMLMGDSADWVKGLPGVTPEMKKRWPSLRVGNCGQMAAAAILSDSVSEKDVQERVWFCYKSYWESHGYKHWRTGQAYPCGIETAKIQFIEQGRLLHMRQKEGELWEPKYAL